MHMYIYNALIDFNSVTVLEMIGNRDLNANIA